MRGKSQLLAARLAALPDDEVTAQLTFAEVDPHVGGLPPYPRTLRQWWANSFYGQVLAWRDAGWRATVDFPARRVRFARGRVGGT